MGIEGISVSSIPMKASSEPLGAAVKGAQSSDVQNTKQTAANETQANTLGNSKGSEVNLKNAVQDVLRNLSGNIEKNEALMKSLPPEVKSAVEQILKNTVQQSDLSEGVVKFLQNAKSGADQVMKLANNLDQLVKQFADGAQGKELKEALTKALQGFQLTATVDGKELQIKNESALLAMMQKFDGGTEGTLTNDVKKLMESLQNSQKAGGENQQTASSKQELSVPQKAFQELLQKTADLPQSVQAKFQQLLTQGDFSAIINNLQSIIKEQEKAGSGKEKTLEKLLDALKGEADSAKTSSDTTKQAPASAKSEATNEAAPKAAGNDEMVLPKDIKKMIDTLQNMKTDANNGQGASTNTDIKQEVAGARRVLQEILQKMPNLPMDVQIQIQQIMSQSDSAEMLTSLQTLLKNLQSLSENGAKGNKLLKNVLEQFKEQADDFVKNLSPEERELLNAFTEKMYDGTGKMKAELLQNKDDPASKLFKNLAAMFGMKDVSESAMLTKGQVDDAKKALKEIAFSMQKGIVVESDSTQQNKVFTVSVPLCFAEGEKPYPAYIQVFKDKGQEKQGEQEKKAHGIWMRVVVETENIGVIENSFHWYGENQMSVKIRATDIDVVDMINDNKEEVKESLEGMEFDLEDFLANTSG